MRRSVRSLFQGRSWRFPSVVPGAREGRQRLAVVQRSASPARRRPLAHERVDQRRAQRARIDRLGQPRQARAAQRGDRLGVGRTADHDDRKRRRRGRARLRRIAARSPLAEVVIDHQRLRHSRASIEARAAEIDAAAATTRALIDEFLLHRGGAERIVVEDENAAARERFAQGLRRAVPGAAPTPLRAARA